MMRQFEVVRTARRTYLIQINTDRWDYFWGFSRFIKELPCLN